MITFNHDKSDNIRIFHYDDIPSIYQKYNEYLDKALSVKEIDSAVFLSSRLKELKPDTLENIVEIEALTIFEKIKNNKKNLSTTSEIIEKIKNRSKSIFMDILLFKVKNEADKLEEDKNIYEEISVHEAQKIFHFLALCDENSFDGKLKIISKEKIVLIKRCIQENVHSHTSKFVHSSSNYSLFDTKQNNSLRKIGLNSKTIDLGLPFTTFDSGGVGRDYTTLMKSIRQFYTVNKKPLSVVKIIDLIFKNEEHCDVTYYFKNISDLNIEENEKNLGENLMHLSQLLVIPRNNDKGVLNLIPVPSVKMMSALSVINEISTIQVINEKNKKSYKKWRFEYVKSVASNPQNISSFASSKGGSFPRMNNLPYIGIQKSKTERAFYKLTHVLAKRKVSNKDENLSKFSYVKFLQDSEAKLALPNRLLNKISNDFLFGLSSVLFSKLKYIQRDVSSLSNLQNLETKISQDKQLRALQTFVLSKELTNEQKEIITDSLLSLYEDISYLSTKEIAILKEKIGEKLCS